VKYCYAGGTISSEEVLNFLGLAGMSGSVLTEIIRRKEMVKKAAELGIKATDEQLQAFADSYRSARGLRTAEATTKFLKTWGLTDDDFEAFCESAVMAHLLEEKFANDAGIQDYFANSRAEFDTAQVSVIIVEKESLANELRMQVTEDGEDFHELTRKHSIDEATKHAGGYLGIVSRSMFEPDVAAKVFNASVGDVVGPFECDGQFRIILVEDVIRADIKREDVRLAVKKAIMNKWMSQFLKNGIRVECGVFEQGGINK
jgi:parvulin-like peptidyl-prolyl isomerase